MIIQDVIQRVVDLPVSKDRAWRAISTPDEISRWFSEKISFESKVGAEIVFEWDEYGKKYGRVEIINPPNSFAFRWLAGRAGTQENLPIDTTNSTLVLMELTDTPQGTRLTVTESGFASLSEDLRNVEIPKNESGWDWELNDLTKYLSGEQI